MTDPVEEDRNVVREKFETELARAAGLSFRSKRLGLRVSDVLHESSETNDKHRIPELETIVVFFDEAILLYLSLNFLLLVLLKQTLDRKAKKTFRSFDHAAS
jgi:hypothetical protein